MLFAKEQNVGVAVQQLCQSSYRREDNRHLPTSNMLSYIIVLILRFEFIQKSRVESKCRGSRVNSRVKSIEFDKMSMPSKYCNI